MQNRGAARSTSTVVFLNFGVCALSRPRHFCPMGTMIITRVALFTSNGSLANITMRKQTAPNEKNKVRFGSGPNKRTKGLSWCECTHCYHAQVWACKNVHPESRTNNFKTSLRKHRDVITGPKGHACMVIYILHKFNFYERRTRAILFS
ncbi:hypothetical protein ILYODFUR_010488 [Ilyodon furcidens]|uniref:Secreted protein n=1 Tax=Ilyodon furcidens TaxID=33524 RepID=A0ABV0TIN3_9TELE